MKLTIIFLSIVILTLLAIIWNMDNKFSIEKQISNVNCSLQEVSNKLK